MIKSNYDQISGRAAGTGFSSQSLNENGPEAILIGNMAAALHGAPVSTIDIDLFFRKTPRNMQKLKLVLTHSERSFCVSTILFQRSSVSNVTGCTSIL